VENVNIILLGPDFASLGFLSGVIKTLGDSGWSWQGPQGSGGAAAGARPVCMATALKQMLRAPRGQAAAELVSRGNCLMSNH